MKKLLFVLLIPLVGCISIIGIKNDWGYHRIENIKSKLLIVSVESEMYDNYGNFLQTLKGKGVAFPIGDGYIVSLNHLVGKKNSITVFTPFGPFMTPAITKTHKIMTDDIELELLGSKGDVAILYHESFKDGISYPFGDSDRLNLGDNIMSVGYSFARELNFKTGVISNLKLDAESYDSPVLVDCFLHTIPSNPGDSGSPIFAWQDGRIKIVGILNAGIPDHGLAFAIKSNYVKETIQEVKNNR